MNPCGFFVVTKFTIYPLLFLSIPLKLKYKNLVVECRTKVEKVFAQLQEKGVICDLRGQVMRVAPVPLYNTYKDVYMFTRILGETLSAQKGC